MDFGQRQADRFCYVGIKFFSIRFQVLKDFVHLISPANVKGFPSREYSAAMLHLCVGNCKPYSAEAPITAKPGDSFQQ